MVIAIETMDLEKEYWVGQLSVHALLNVTSNSIKVNSSPTAAITIVVPAFLRSVYPVNRMSKRNTVDALRQ